MTSLAFVEIREVNAFERWWLGLLHRCHGKPMRIVRNVSHNTDFEFVHPCRYAMCRLCGRSEDIDASSPVG